MKEFFIYEGKVALLLVAFYLFFKVLLSRETFHRLNRMILLGTSLLAFVLPFCVITYTREVSAAEASRMMTNISIEAMPQEILLDGPTIWPWVMLVWSLGALAVLLNHLWSMLSIARLLRSSNSMSGDRQAKIHIFDKELTPFSWMGHIVLSRQDFEENGSVIITHERAHIRLAHSIDNLLMLPVLLLQWFNPAVWLLMRDLREIHEFEADESVLASGVNAKDYQLLLIKKAVGKRYYSIANSLNHSKLKNRISMMLSKKSSVASRCKALSLLLVVGLSLAATAQVNPVLSINEVVDQERGKEKSEKEGLTLFMNADGSFLVKGTILTLDGLKMNKADAVTIVIDENVKQEDVAKVKEFLREHNVLKINLIKAETTKEITSVSVNELNSPQIMIDGALSDENALKNLNPETIDEVKVDKDKNSIIITTKARESETTAHEEEFVVVEEMPQFPGGNEAMIKFIAENLIYPKTAMDKGEQGRVILSFVIDKRGKVGDVKLIRSVSPELDAEAVRVIQAMPDWIPGKQKGKAVNVRYTIPIVFKLSK
ncbi:MAG: TonB family protein [Bacteroidales bacterium]|nr:TonB family protein [Bacteroidales bacterium]